MLKVTREVRSSKVWRPGPISPIPASQRREIADCERNGEALNMMKRKCEMSFQVIAEFLASDPTDDELLAYHLFPDDLSARVSSSALSQSARAELTCEQVENWMTCLRANMIMSLLKTNTELRHQGLGLMAISAAAPGSIRTGWQDAANTAAELEVERLVSGFDVDHIVPLKHGGDDNDENLCLACPALQPLQGRQCRWQSTRSDELT